MIKLTLAGVAVAALMSLGSMGSVAHAQGVGIGVGPGGVGIHVDDGHRRGRGDWRRDREYRRDYRRDRYDYRRDRYRHHHRGERIYIR